MLKKLNKWLNVDEPEEIQVDEDDSDGEKEEEKLMEDIAAIVQY